MKRCNENIVRNKTALVGCGACMRSTHEAGAKTHAKLAIRNAVSVKHSEYIHFVRCACVSRYRPPIYKLYTMHIYSLPVKHRIRRLSSNL